MKDAGPSPVKLSEISPVGCVRVKQWTVAFINQSFTEVMISQFEEDRQTTW